MPSQSLEVVRSQATAVAVVDQPRGVQLSTHLMQCQGSSFVKALQVQCNGLAIADIIKDKYPCVRQLAREHGEDKIKNRVKVLLLWCNELANLQRGLTPVLIDRLADKIVEEYPYYNFTMQDLNMLIERGVSGQYSKDGMLLVINATVVISWMDKYFEERVSAAMQYNYTEDESLPSPYERRSTKETLRGMITRLRNKQNYQ